MEFNSILYLAKPTIGGWVSFTSHLAYVNDIPLLRLSKKTETKGREPKYRDFGYNILYHNISIDDFINEGLVPIVSAIDKNYYHYIEKLPKGTIIVIHDPTELKSLGEYLTYFKTHFKIITIRETVHKILLSKDIPNTFLLHPYLESSSLFPSEASKTNAVSISRIDYDKHTEIILKANQLLLSPIHIYGAKNDRYVYNKLNKLDTMRENSPGSNYIGKFPKSYKHLAKILSEAKYVVDMSRIKNDGGGTQYTFLEAIDFNCALILHDDWVNVENSVFKKDFNCFTVKDENELIELLNSNQDITNIIKNARLILDKHCKNEGWRNTNVVSDVITDD